MDDDDPNGDTSAMPMVIAPWTYFLDLQGRTGATMSTPASLLRWVMQDDTHRVEMTRHLIVLDVVPRPVVNSPDVPDGQNGAIIVDGVAAIDLTRYDGVRLDYCAYCVGERGCSRLETLTSPQAQHDHGRGWVALSYRCAHGHIWESYWGGAEPQ